MIEEAYYDEIIEWIQKVMNDKELSNEKKVRLLGSVL